MEIVQGEKLSQEYADLIRRVAADERIIVSYAGQQIALVSMDDLVFLEDMDDKWDEQALARAEDRLADPNEKPIPFVPTILLPETAHLD